MAVLIQSLEKILFTSGCLKPAVCKYIFMKMVDLVILHAKKVYCSRPYYAGQLQFVVHDSNFFFLSLSVLAKTNRKEKFTDFIHMLI